MGKKLLSIIIPCYNEEKTVETIYVAITDTMDMLPQYDYEILFINDGSKDNTLPILENIAKEDSKIKVISFSRNFGHQAAVTAGLKFITGDCAVIIDADLQDPPELIPDMVKEWEKGYDVIYGKRKKRDGESAFKLLTAKAFYQTLNKLSDIEIQKIQEILD